MRGAGGGWRAGWSEEFGAGDGPPPTTGNPRSRLPTGKAGLWLAQPLGFLLRCAEDKQVSSGSLFVPVLGLVWGYQCPVTAAISCCSKLT